MVQPYEAYTNNIIAGQYRHRKPEITGKKQQLNNAANVTTTKHNANAYKSHPRTRSTQAPAATQCCHRVPDLQRFQQTSTIDRSFGFLSVFGRFSCFLLLAVLLAYRKARATAQTTPFNGFGEVRRVGCCRRLRLVVGVESRKILRQVLRQQGGRQSAGGVEQGEAEGSMSALWIVTPLGVVLGPRTFWVQYVFGVRV